MSAAHLSHYRTISLLTTDVKTKIFIDVNREMIEEVLKILNIAVKVSARRSNAMWDILLTTEEALAGNVLTTKCFRLQTENMGTKKTRIALHGLPMSITEDYLGVFFLTFEWSMRFQR